MNKKIDISGVSESRSARMISEMLEKGRQCLVIVSGRNRAERLRQDLSFFCGREIAVLPPEEQTFLRYEARNNDQRIARLSALKRLASDPEALIIAPASAAIKKLPPHHLFSSSVIGIERGAELDPAELRSELVGLGYERSGLAAAPGYFAVRGSIIDIFTPEAPDPYRIELFGTEVDSIRSFDADSQRSIENLAHVDIYPARQFIREEAVYERAVRRITAAYDRAAGRARSRGEDELASGISARKNELIGYIENTDNPELVENYVHYFYDEAETIADYMREGIIVVDDPDRVTGHLDLREREAINDFEVMLERGQVVPEDREMIGGSSDLIALYDKKDICFLTPFSSAIRGVERLDELRTVDSRQTFTAAGHLDMAAGEIRRFVSRGYEVTVAASSKERLETIGDFLAQNGLDGKVKVLRGSLSSGCDFPKEKKCWISDGDIFGSSRSGRRRRHRSGAAALRSFTDLHKGDYVVHENHGIGIFSGIRQLDAAGDKKDYLEIRYAGKDVLYVPVEQMDMVQKYIGAEGLVPKISRLGGDEWAHAKSRARAAIADMTEELVELYSQRQHEQGHAFGPDTVWQKEFEEAFPYEETEDQMRSVEEIKADMERPEPMDRLLCGDVGYGKTEVAARAIFKCVSDGKQAAFLVPTTILASQHYDTLKARLSRYPFRIDMLSRFRSDKEQEAIVKSLARGETDLIIGTHRLLSGDVVFRDLGLLVVDEEQRFGVADKEKIKKLRTNVDVLTLSATPIPRTLNMSLTGIKDMSLINEPPEDRYPVQTYVTEQDDMTIREVINRELDRDGQVFVVYNRVRGINRVADRIRALVPEARVAVGHGQMSEASLEEVMRKFISRDFDVLVATTIIESGLDIPNANTMIILDADKCGLAQLYQLRGRVGRSSRVAYAYLMYQKEKVLSEVAVRRLKAIREFTEFGAGFKIAMRDMEIRGAGNVLGAEQSGHMMSIGYELYCKLMDDAVRRARGEMVPERSEEIAVELEVNANIPEWYIEDESLRLQMYKRIASISSREDMDDVRDEMLDRFGDLPRETLDLTKVSLIRALAGRLALRGVSEHLGRVILYFDKKNMLSVYALTRVNGEFGRKAFFHGGVEPFIRLSSPEKDRLDDTIRLMECILDNKDKNMVS